MSLLYKRVLEEQKVETVSDRVWVESVKGILQSILLAVEKPLNRFRIGSTRNKITSKTIIVC